MDFTIIMDVDYYPVAVLKGHVEVADTGYNSTVIYCTCDEGTAITDAVESYLSSGIGCIGSVQG